MMSPDRTMHDDELARELRAMRPEIDADFGAQLDAWAAEGFPSAQELERRDGGADAAPLRERFRAWRERRPMVPVLAGAATIVLAVSVSVGVLSGLESESPDDTSLTPLSGDAPSAVESQRESLDDSGAGAAIEPSPTTVPPVPPRQDQLKPGEPRQIERTASMTLSTEPDEVDDVADGVIEVAERYDGIVVSSQVNTSGERGRASFDLRIPSQNLQAALADLSDLASVSSRNEGTLDVTAPFVTAEERFDDAKAEVDALLQGLTQADSAAEIAQIRERLRIARSELAAARSELAALKQRTDFSTLAVTVTGDGDSDGWSLGDAVDDAGSVLEDLAGATLVALSALIPLGLIGAVAWLVYGRIRRRRQDKLLDQ